MPDGSNKVQIISSRGVLEMKKVSAARHWLSGDIGKFRLLDDAGRIPCAYDDCLLFPLRDKDALLTFLRIDDSLCPYRDS